MNPFANDDVNAAYFEEERRLLGLDPKSHGYADRLADSADLLRKQALEEGGFVCDVDESAGMRDAD